MENNTHNQTKPVQVTVYRDGELDPDYLPKPPTLLESAVSHVEGAVKAFVGNVALQSRMAIFDYRHGTNYRSIRNELMEQKKREEFQARIGLVAIRH